MAVTAGRLTTTSQATWIPEVWDSETLDAIEFKTIIYDTVDKKLENVLKVGDIAHVPRRSNLTPQTKAAGSDVTFEQITEGEQTLTVATHEYAAVYVEDITEAQAKFSVRSRYTDAMGYALARGLDVAIAALFQNFSVVFGTLGQELTDDSLLDSWRSLQEASVPEGERHTLLSPRAIAGLMKIDKFVNQLYVGGAGEQVKEGIPLRRIYGTTLRESNLLRIPAANQSEGAMYHSNQMFVVRQGKPSTILLHNPQGIGWQVVTHNFYGMTEVARPPETPGGGTAVDTWGVLLRTL